MRILKFEGATMRDAIAKVKAELGDQAVIISTRQVRRGLLGGNAVEISAAVDDGNDTAASTGPSVGGPIARAHTRRAETVAEPEVDVEKLIAPLRNELRSLRAMVRASASTAEPRGNDLRSEVAALKKLVAEIGSRREEPAPAPIALAPQPAQRKAAPLVRPSTANMIMLVGPTGAGKTTTIAKIAARAALIDGKRVKLVTLDTYRVGGVDQIRTYADLIGVPLEVVDHPSQLGAALDDTYDLVLIDTAGRSPRDTESIHELAGVRELSRIEVHLVIPAATSAAQIDELVARYRPLVPERLLFTKLDELEQPAEIAQAPARIGLSITWVTTGQDVPEDIEEPTATRVLELASGALMRGRFTHTRGAA